MRKFLRPLFEVAIVCGVIALVVITKDKMLFWCALFSIVGYYAVIRRSPIVYGKDGIAYDPNTLNTWIYDLRKYFQDSVRKENLKKQLEAIKRIPLNVPLDDNFQPIGKKKQ